MQIPPASPRPPTLSMDCYSGLRDPREEAKVGTAGGRGERRALSLSQAAAPDERSRSGRWAIGVAVLTAVLSAKGADGSDFARVDEYVSKRLREHRIGGASLVIVQRDAVLHARGFGLSHRDVAMTADTPVVIGSLSKAFTATAVMQLVDGKKIELDAPVQRYVPEFRLADPAAASNITVRQLLNQSSGIPTKAPRANRSPASLLDHVAALRDTKLVSSPGGPHVYSSPNYQILGLIVERASGMSFAAYLQQRIFAPLGMTRTFTDAAAAESAGLATGHNLWFGAALPSSYRHEPDRLPTASIITTARDLGRFVSAHLGEGPPLLSPESLRIAHTGVAPEGSYFKYAMGWRAGQTAGVDSLWHGGSLPSYRSAVVLIPERKLGIILLTNSASMFADHSREIAAGIVSLLHDREPRAILRPLGQTYLGIAVASAIILLLLVRSVVNAARGVGKRGSKGSTLFFNIMIPMAIVFGLPLWMKVPWRAMYEGAPDVTVVLALVLILTVISGILKLRGPGEKPAIP